MDIVVMPGDGIGEEITAATLGVLRKADELFGLNLNFNTQTIGFAAYEKTGTTFPDAVLERARQADGILLGPISHMDYPDRDKGGVNISAAVRVKLDLFANVRPAKTRPGVPHKGTEMDLVIMRECTEGMYPDRNMFRGHAEVMPDPDMAISMRKITRKACTRIAKSSFELAMKRRKKVSAVHKANNFIQTDGLFLEAVRNVSKQFPEVEYEELIVDATAALLVRDASQFDVICSTNFYCDILSDLASELSGSLGLAGSINANETMCCAQAQHGSAPDIAGQNKANPTSLILSAAMLFNWFEERRKLAKFGAAGREIERSIEACIADSDRRTADLGGAMACDAFGRAVEAEMKLP